MSLADPGHYHCCNQLWEFTYLLDASNIHEVWDCCACNKLVSSLVSKSSVCQCLISYLDAYGTVTVTVLAADCSLPHHVSDIRSSVNVLYMCSGMCQRLMYIFYLYLVRLSCEIDKQ